MPNPQSPRSLAARETFRVALAELGATLAEPDWLGTRAKHHVICRQGHDCYPRPGSIYAGQGPCITCAGCDPVAAMAGFRARLAAMGATLIEPEWLGAGSKHRAICAGGHDCYARPTNVSAGQGICRICAGQSPEVAAAAFRARLAELGATLLDPSWLGAMTKHHVLCRAGHDVYTKPNWIQQGRGLCRRCAGLDPADAEAAFRARLAELGAELLEPYKGSGMPHRIRCIAGHEGNPRPGDVAKGDGVCRTCAGKDPAVAEARFRELLADLGAVPLYDRWLGIDKRHRVQCSAGHECEPVPSAARRWGTICPACSGKDPAASEAKFLARLAELGATPLYDRWTNSHDRLHVRCAAGHDTYATPSDVNQGHGFCRHCVGKDWDAFYVVQGSGVIKFGITTGDPRPRLRVHAAQGFTKVVRLTTGLPGTIAPDTERAIISTLAMAGEKPVQGREYFDISCLALVLDVADSWLSTPDAPIIREWVQAELFAA